MNLQVVVQAMGYLLFFLAMIGVVRGGSSCRSMCPQS